MWFIYPLVFLAGFVDSIAGGGGLISLTSYVAVGLPAHIALGTNKLSSVVGTGIAMVRFAKNGHVRWAAAGCSFAGALAGSAIGARLALGMDERVLTWLLVGIVPAVALFLLFKKDFGVLEKELPAGKTALYSVLTGFVIGGYDGFFGPGTGTFLIMAFTTVLGFQLLTACGNAKVVNFASNLAAVGTFIANGTVNYRIGIPCAVCSIVGSFIGSGLAMKKGVKIVRPMMLVVIALLLIKIAWDLLTPQAI